MLGLVSILALLLAVANDPYVAMMADITPQEQRAMLLKQLAHPLPADRSQRVVRLAVESNIRALSGRK